jgi:hypothetical protein
MTPSRNHPINCGTATSQFARANPKQTIAQRSADLSFVSEPQTITPSSTQSVTLGDINYSRANFALAGTNLRVQLDYLVGQFNRIKQITSSNPSVLSVSTTDPMLLEYQSAGQSRITVELADGEQITSQVTATQSPPGFTDTFVSFVPGSLGKHVFDQMRLYANNTTLPPQHYRIYSTFNFTQNIYEKNTSGWAAALDFSGMMVNKTGSPGVTRVSAITPHHAIGASHYGPEVGDVIYFCDQNNQTIARTVSARTDLGGNTDSCIVRFSQALPPTVKTYRTLPSNYLDYAPVNRADLARRCTYWPLIATSHYRWDAEWPLQRQGRFAYVYHSGMGKDGVFQSSPGILHFIFFSPATATPNSFPNYNGVPSGIRGGDSGGPCFYVINGELVLIQCFFGGNGGPFIPSFRAQIQAALDTLGPGNQTFETVDLSAFTNFAN